jgi:glutamate synthase (NADPH/NADH) large chain
MTGGVAVILGRVGRNLAAGMSGGYGYVLDLDPDMVNRELVDVETVSGEHVGLLRAVIADYFAHTSSAVAADLLADWTTAVSRFRVIVPRDFRRVAEATRRARDTGADVDAAVMAAAQS